MSEELVKLEAPAMALDRPHPREVIRQATEEADELANVIESRKLFAVIQGRKFVKCEGWTTLACLRGCLPREVSVTELPEGRYVAEVELVRMSDGAVLTKASAECGGPEDSVWTKRPPNARRSMAITRATGKACRVAFSWVMALSGYEVTPAEEMEHVGSGDHDSRRDWPSRGVPPPSVAQAAAPPSILDADTIWVGRLKGMATKDGTTGGKAWRLFVFSGADGEKFGTFSDTIAEGLSALDGHDIEITYEAKKNGKSIVSYRDVTLEEAPFGK